MLEIYLMVNVVIKGSINKQWRTVWYGIPVEFYVYKRLYSGDILES